MVGQVHSGRNEDKLSLEMNSREGKSSFSTSRFPDFHFLLLLIYLCSGLGFL